MKKLFLLFLLVAPFFAMAQTPTQGTCTYSNGTQTVNTPQDQCALIPDSTWAANPAPAPTPAPATPAPAQTPAPAPAQQPATPRVTSTPNISGVTCIYPNSEGPALLPDANGACPQGTQYRLNGASANGSTGNITYQPLEPIPGFTGSGNLQFGKLLEALFKILIGLAGFIAIGSFVYAGLAYMLSGSVISKDSAKKRLKGSLYGLCLLLGAWLILYTINPQLVVVGNALNPSQQVSVSLSNPTPPPCTNTASGCLTPQEQAARQNIQRSGTDGVSEQDQNTVRNLAQRQAAECLAINNAQIRPTNGMNCLSSVIRANNSSCSVIIQENGTNAFCVVPN